MSLDTDIARLSRVPLFSVLGTNALRLLAFAAESHPFATGELLFRRGETADGGYLIVSGAVDLFASDDDEAERRIVGPGALIGEQALLAETLRPNGARAVKATATLKVTRAVFTRVLREYPASATAIRQVWAQRLHERLTAE